MWKFSNFSCWSGFVSMAAKILRMFCTRASANVLEARSLQSISEHPVRVGLVRTPNKQTYSNGRRHTAQHISPRIRF